MKVTVKVEGLRECERALAELPKATGKNVLRRVAKGALEPMREHAARIAPDDPATGAPDLRSSITMKEQRTSRTIFRGGKFRSGASTGIAMKMGVPTRIFYGSFQEWGTVKMAANPFMRPAWDAGAYKALDYIKDNLRLEIDKAAVRVARKRAKAAK